MPNNRFVESTLEEAFIGDFEEKHPGVYRYICGFDITRTNTEIIIKKDFEEYLSRRYGDLGLQEDEIAKMLNHLEAISDASLYSMMNKTLQVLRDGYNLDRSESNQENRHLEYFDWENPDGNIFRIVNQYEVQGYEKRRPDVIVFINGIPVSVIELKNPADENATVHNAYEQVHTRYSRDIPRLMRYSFVTVISDGINTKVGSLFASYKHFYPWKSTDGKSYCNDGVESMETMIAGLFEPRTILNMVKNYIYFPDTDERSGRSLAAKELMIIPKYSQYYASEALFKNIKEHMRPEGDGKGGTYFGATGCGKSYTMLFLSRLLSTSKELRNPTIVLLTDRNDLDEQLAKIFECSKTYLVDQNTARIDSRKDLKEKLEGIQSGGVYLLTIQKFDEDVGLLSDRDNIVCISDEAHRTQLNLDSDFRETEEGLKKSFGFAKYLRDSLPNATYVGFTGTPIDLTLQVFGPIVMSYKMKQSRADGSTVGISIFPGPSAVRLDEEKLKIVDDYYRAQLEAGTNENQVRRSQREMATVRTIIDNDSRLDLVVKHMVDHYEKRLSEGATVNGRAMFVCYDRKIAYKVYKRIIELKPEWNVKRRTLVDESHFSRERLDTLKPIEMVKLVATRRKDDEPELYNLLGDDNYRSELARIFKDEDSNFKIAIVVDMWITGFDCESLDTMYIDKPLENQSLIQTISRVNRVFKDKEEGLIVDYIGFEAALARALNRYDGDENPTTAHEDSYAIFQTQLSILDAKMSGFDMDPFLNGTPIERLRTLQKGVEFIQRSKKVETEFVGVCLRMKMAYEVCLGDPRIDEATMDKVHFYCAIRSAIVKMTPEGRPDSDRMNEEVKKLVDDCIIAYSQIQDSPATPIDIFSGDYLEKIHAVPYENTRFKMLLALLRKAIREYGKTNKIKAVEFSKRMKAVVDRYNDRDHEIVTGQDVVVDNEKVLEEFLAGLTAEAEKILQDLQADANEFKELGITFDEKAFYDILKAIRDNEGFAYEEEDLISLAKEIKKIVDDKSKYVDWTSKTQIRSKLYMEIAKLLKRKGYPPRTAENVYEQVLAQVENYKTYND